MGKLRYQRTAQRMTSAGKRKPRNARASVIGGALGWGGGGSAAPTRSRRRAQRDVGSASVSPDDVASDRGNRLRLLVRRGTPPARRPPDPSQTGRFHRSWRDAAPSSPRGKRARKDPPSGQCNRTARFILPLYRV